MTRQRRPNTGNVPALVIDPKELETFRATLPTYRQYEKYQVLIVRWDIVRAQFLVFKHPREQTAVNVLQAAQVLGFPTHDDASATDADGQEKPFHGLYQVDARAAMSEETDLERPVLLAQVMLPGDTTPSIMQLDGLHRLYKASRTGRPHLPCYLLTPEEEQACRC